MLALAAQAMSKTTIRKMASARHQALTPRREGARSVGVVDGVSGMSKFVEAAMDGEYALAHQRLARAGKPARHLRTCSRSRARPHRHGFRVMIRPAK
jgi:hypothetical protein